MGRASYKRERLGGQSRYAEPRRHVDQIGHRSGVHIAIGYGLLQVLIPAAPVVLDSQTVLRPITLDAQLRRHRACNRPGSSGCAEGPRRDRISGAVAVRIANLVVAILPVGRSISS